MSSKLQEGYADKCRQFGTGMLSDLITAYAARWAVLRHFEHMAAELGIALPDEGHALSAILFPRRSPTLEVELREEHRATAVDLAQRWIESGPTSRIISDWLACDREAREHGVSYPNSGEIVAEEVASKAVDVRPWFREMQVQRAPASLLRPFAWRACQEDQSALDAFVTLSGENGDYSGLVMECLLRFSRPGAAAWEASRHMLPQHAEKIGTSVLRNQLDDETILWLLQNGGSAVAREVASNLWSADPRGYIPDTLQAAWQQAVVNHLAEDYEWEEIAKQHPELACAWLRKRLNQTYEERHALESDFMMNHYLPRIIAALTKEQRRGLIDHVAEGNLQGNLVAELVTGDLDLMRHSLSRPITAELAQGCLGSPEEDPHGWDDRAIVLLEHGLSVQEVLEASHPCSVGGIGEFSEHYERRRLAYAAFADHADSRVREVCALANAWLADCRDDALKRERLAAVRGDIF